MRRGVLKKSLDRVGTPPYATPSMSSPLSPEMLKKGRVCPNSRQCWGASAVRVSARERRGRFPGFLPLAELAAGFTSNRERGDVTHGRQA